MTRVQRARRRGVAVGVALGVMLGLLLAGYALAQGPGGADLHWWGKGAGGVRASANFRIEDSAGQAVAGVSVSANYRIESGFVVGAAGGATLYLPVVQK